MRILGLNDSGTERVDLCSSKIIAHFIKIISTVLYQDLNWLSNSHQLHLLHTKISPKYRQNYSSRVEANMHFFPTLCGDMNEKAQIEDNKVYFSVVH